jgi:hypothetical protein
MVAIVMLWAQCCVIYSQQQIDATCVTADSATPSRSMAGADSGFVLVTAVFVRYMHQVCH